MWEVCVVSSSITLLLLDRTRWPLLLRCRTGRDTYTSCLATDRCGPPTGPGKAKLRDVKEGLLWENLSNKFVDFWFSTDFSWSLGQRKKQKSLKHWNRWIMQQRSLKNGKFWQRKEMDGLNIDADTILDGQMCNDKNAMTLNVRCYDLNIWIFEY